MCKLHPVVSRLPAMLVAALVASQTVQRVGGVILLDSGDPTTNTSTPGDNSGWQFEGRFDPFLGTPIAPRYFLTAKHIGGSVGSMFVFHGENFTTTAIFPDPSTDLQIWQVDHDFLTYAPLYTQSGSEPGQELRVFGRGTQRGPAMTLGGTLRGWAWGPGDNVERWGRNLVTAIVSSNSPAYLQSAFDSPGLPSEAALSVGDSGGGVFILQDGLWRLAGINYGVDDLFTAPDPSTQFVAAIFDARGYYTQNPDDSFTQIEDVQNVPTSFYSTEVAARLAWIQSVTGQDPTVLPPEDFTAWQHAYFTPDQLADANVSGPLADPDNDGIANLLEFAFNLDPTFPETALLIAGTGLRGLPLIHLTTIAPGDERLTVEFVRRTAASGSGVVYAVEFTPGLDAATVNRQASGTESATAINSRWERVVVTDSVPMSASGPRRFARVVVTQNAASISTPACGIPTANAAGAAGRAKTSTTPKQPNAHIAP